MHKHSQHFKTDKVLLVQASDDGHEIYKRNMMVLYRSPETRSIANYVPGQYWHSEAVNNCNTVLVGGCYIRFKKHVLHNHSLRKPAPTRSLK